MKVIIAGGGTGGHLFPGIALAHELKRRDSSVEILFIGTKIGIESRVVPKEGFKIKYIYAEGFTGKGIFKKIKSILKTPAGTFQSMMILNSFKPDIVIGVGGYAFGPVGMAALFLARLKPRTTKLVIQEQNLFPGLTNRVLGRFADLIFTSFEGSGKFFMGRKIYFTGNPVRKEIAEIHHLPFTIHHSLFTILVFGGSQGAHRINLAMIDSLKSLAKIRDSVFIIHQTGEKDFEFVKKAYEENKFNGEVVPFIYDMADVYRRADLLICRSGATTLSEITACGKAAILIPFPFAVNNHQEMNALALKEHNAAEMILEKELHGELLADMILSLMQDKERLANLERGSRKMGKPEAALEIVEQCYKIIQATSN
ncbi:MAG: undecaprenyldiphospho-muramoylpentapeptide beta-N-acetylglucosaminyltransferase [Nitrospinota bacterium]